MTDAYRMQKFLASAEAEVSKLKNQVSKLKDLLVEWEKWEAAVIDDESRSICEPLDDVNYEWMLRLQKQRNEALKR